MSGRRAPRLRSRTSARGGWLPTRSSRRRSAPTAERRCGRWPGSRRSPRRRARPRGRRTRCSTNPCRRSRGCAVPRIRAIRWSATRAPHPRRTRRLGRAHARDVAHRVDTSKRVAGSPGRRGSTALRHAGVLHDRGTRCTGTPRNRSWAGAGRRRARPPASPDPAPRPMVRHEPDAPFDERRQDRLRGGGRRRDRGADGITTWIATSSRTPRSRRYPSSRIAASLGAGGHLKGAPHTPTIAVPLRRTGARRAGPRRGDGVELVAGLGRPGVAARSWSRERHDQDVGLVGSRSVVTRRASGSIEVIVSWRNRT